MACSVKFNLFSGKNQKKRYFTLSICYAPLLILSDIKKREGYSPPFSGFSKCLSLELEAERAAQCEAIGLNTVDIIK